MNAYATKPLHPGDVPLCVRQVWIWIAAMQISYQNQKYKLYMLTEFYQTANQIAALLVGP